MPNTSDSSSFDDSSFDFESLPVDESSDADSIDSLELRPSFARKSINMDDVKTEGQEESFTVVRSERLLEVDLNNLTQDEYNLFEEALFAWRKGARASTFFTVLESGTERLQRIAENLTAIYETQSDEQPEKKVSGDIVKLLRSTNPRGRNALKQLDDRNPESLDITKSTFHCSCGQTRVTVRPLIDPEDGTPTPGVFEVSAKIKGGKRYTCTLTEDTNDGEGIVVGRQLVARSLFGVQNESGANVIDLMPDICVAEDHEFSQAGMRLQVKGGLLFIYNCASLNPFKDFSHPDLPSKAVTSHSEETGKKVQEVVEGPDTLLTPDDDEHGEVWRKQNELETWNDGDDSPPKK